MLSLATGVTLEPISKLRKADTDRVHERGTGFFGLLLDQRIAQRRPDRLGRAPDGGPNRLHGPLVGATGTWR